MIKRILILAVVRFLSAALTVGAALPRVDPGRGHGGPAGVL